jgi:hypothetical protein
MENVNIKINLAALTHIELKVRDRLGKEVQGIFIPYEKNKIFVGQKVRSLDLIGFPLKNRKPDSKDTHIIKQSFSKEEREKMTQEQQNNLPIIGNMIDWNYVKQSGNEDPDLPHDAVVETTEEDLPY